MQWLDCRFQRCKYRWIIEGEFQAYAALGDGGNVIYVCPLKGLVVAIASTFKPRAKDRIEFIKKNILSEYLKIV